MGISAVYSSLDVANWFFKKAEKDGWYLENEKLHHLLFLSQVHYALQNNNAYLMPSLFVCTTNGFADPTLQQALSFGRPLMEAPLFSTEINAFLEFIWNKYALQTLRDLNDIVKSSPLYKENFQAGQINFVTLPELTAKFKETGETSSAETHQQKKILLSQNGPVVVSPWQPRKLNLSKTKENLNA